MLCSLPLVNSTWFLLLSDLPLCVRQQHIILTALRPSTLCSSTAHDDVILTAEERRNMLLLLSINNSMQQLELVANRKVVGFPGHYCLGQRERNVWAVRNSLEPRTLHFQFAFAITWQTWRPGDMEEAWGHGGGLGTWRPGDMEAWGHGGGLGTWLKRIKPY